MARKKPEPRLPQGPPEGGEQPIVRKTWRNEKQKTKADGNTWGRAQSEVIRRTRASLITEMTLKGINKVQIGEHFGISRQRVKQIAKWAEEQGIVEEVRERIRQSLLPQAADVYKMLFDLKPEDIANQKVLKGYELKLKAAKHIADGVGAFRRQSEDKKTVEGSVDLVEFMAMRRAKLEDAANAPEFRQLQGGIDPAGGDLPDGAGSDREVLDAELVGDSG